MMMHGVQIRVPRLTYANPRGLLRPWFAITTPVTTALIISFVVADASWLDTENIHLKNNVSVRLVPLHLLEKGMA